VECRNASSAVPQMAWAESGLMYPSRPAVTVHPHSLSILLTLYEAKHPLGRAAPLVLVGKSVIPPWRRKHRSAGKPAWVSLHRKFKCSYFHTHPFGDGSTWARTYAHGVSVVVARSFSALDSIHPFGAGWICSWLHPHRLKKPVTCKIELNVVGRSESSPDARS
jgi:hypothetical protein